MWKTLAEVCAKNMTKVDWIADRLGNGSLPLDFTGTVFVETLPQNGMCFMCMSACNVLFPLHGKLSCHRMRRLAAEDVPF